MRGDKPVEIVRGVYWIGVNDTETDLFESIWSLPHGVSYNSYLVMGEEGIAVIDLVASKYGGKLLKNISEIVDPSRISYIVLNHLEQDHTGSLPEVLEKAPNARIVVSKVAASMIKYFYDVEEERIIVVGDGETLSIGGRTLEFVYLPWLHWPETMGTYLVEDKILFSCDAFGSYGALLDGVFDDEVDMALYLEEAKRYFSNIVSKHSSFVIRAVEKLKSRNIEIKILAPSHGPIYRRNPGMIIEEYVKWSKPELRKKVVVIYSSMYGNVKKLIDEAVKVLRANGVETILFDVARSDISYILKETIDASTILVGSSTYEANVFPLLSKVLDFLALKNTGKGKTAGIIEVHGWAPTTKFVRQKLVEAGFDIIEPVVEVRGTPRSNDIRRARELARRIWNVVLQIE